MLGLDQFRSEMGGFKPMYIYFSEDEVEVGCH